MEVPARAAVSGGSKVAIIRKGEGTETQAPLVYERQLGSRQSGMRGPRSLLLRAPITLRHAYSHTHAHGHLHTILLLDKERDDALRDLPANSHTCTYIGQTTQQN